MVGGMGGLAKACLNMRSELTLLFMLTIIHVPQHAPPCPKVGFSDL